MTIQTIDKEVLEEIKRVCKKNPAAEHTSFHKFKDVEYSYMAEVDPHIDMPTTDETVWTITFIAARKNYFFIYELDGEQFCVEPELGKPYSFNFEKRHAFIRARYVPKFNDKGFWKKDSILSQKLSCIFTFETLDAYKEDI
jgi:hypothetical protein